MQAVKKKPAIKKSNGHFEGEEERRYRPKEWFEAADSEADAALVKATNAYLTQVRRQLGADPKEVKITRHGLAVKFEKRLKI